MKKKRFAARFASSTGRRKLSVRLFDDGERKAFAGFANETNTFASDVSNRIIMGCKQTTAANAETPPVMIKSPTPGTTFRKSALRKPATTTGRGKAEKLTSVKRNPSLLNRSVNFDEKVQVKLRTPTPRESSYQPNPLMLVRRRRQRSRSTSVSDNDLDDDDQEVTSISSDDDNAPSTTSNSFHQRTSSGNGMWHKSNSVGVIQSKSPVPPASQPTAQIVTVTRPIYPAESSNAVPTGKRFKVRRKLSDDTEQILSPSSIPLESSSVSSTLVPPIVRRNASPPKPTYYAFKHRTRENPH